jgi:NAD(P)-dependent dehydrogenase (short-subunit alcohol dehydrogenase family)
MKTALITGAYGDMGRETAKGLARAGYKVILTGRSAERCAEAADLVRRAVPRSEVEAVPLDLADFSSVAAGADRVRFLTDTLDALVLNAGVMATPWSHTVDGYELQFQVNYLGHFLLWKRLESLMAAAPMPSQAAASAQAGASKADPPQIAKRVVSVSSLSGEKGADRSVEDFARDARIGADGYNPMKSYRESKLAQMLFTRALRDRCRDKGIGAYAVHPGVVNTGLFYAGRSPLYKAAMQPLAWIGYLTGFIVPPAVGARTAIGLASGVLGGGTQEDAPYWAKEKPRPWNPIADDAALAGGLWKWSEEAVQ